MKQAYVNPAILVASIAAICQEPGVFPVSGRPPEALARFKAESERIAREERQWGRKLLVG